MPPGLAAGAAGDAAAAGAALAAGEAGLAGAGELAAGARLANANEKAERKIADRVSIKMVKAFNCGRIKYKRFLSL